MVIVPTPPPRRRVADNVSRDVLLQWLRAHTGDFRIRNVAMADGKRACVARFRFHHETIDVEAVESDEITDPDDAIVRRCAWIVWQRLGVDSGLALYERRRLEKEIIEAARSGRTDVADKLGLELVMLNEQTLSARRPIGTGFQPMGGSMFGKRDGTRWVR